MFVVSNRGPFSFVADPDAPGGYSARPGAGGVASALRALLAEGDTEATWVASALSDDDRAAVRAGATRAPEMDVALLDVDPELARQHYDVVSNGVLWFLHHGMFDHVHEPTFDDAFLHAWDGYRAVNEQFADAVCERATDRDVVLVQDYQLALVPGMIRAARPDLRVVHFTHTPYCGPNSIRTLPTAVATELLRAVHDVPCGFHTARWARAYQASAREMLGGDGPPPAFAASLGPDPDALHEIAASADASAAGAELDSVVQDRKLLLRVDRIDPSKNIVRGFRAYERLLARRPEWRGRVVFVALLNGSRESISSYAAYHRAVDAAAAAVNERWGDADWQPVVLDARDDYARSVAGLARSDVLVVNPIKDGLNLVAKEGPLLNTRDGVLCLSSEAGAFEEIGEHALPMHPYDLEQGAHMLHDALSMEPAERRARASRLRDACAARTPRDWFHDQVKAATSGS